MSDKAYTEVVRRVFDGGEGASVLVRPFDDSFVEIAVSNDQVSIEWFGKKEINFSPKVARAVAEAMLKCADELEKP